MFTNYNGVLSYDKSIQLLEQLSREIAPDSVRGKQPDFPWSSVADMLDHSFNYESLDTDTAIRLRQVHALYSKFEPLRLGIDKERVAYEKFWQSEIACSVTNTFFTERQLGRLTFSPPVEEQLLIAQRKIAEVLGKVPTIESLHLRLGPGATTSTKKKDASITKKFSDPLACSEELVPYLKEVLYELPMLVSSVSPDSLGPEEDVATVSVVVEPAMLSFVLKNAKTYRGICTEPVLNGVVQHGIGSYLKNRLKRFGLDIRRQEPNQALAMEGSLTGMLATLDLSSASDSIATELVAFLLPPEWFNFLSRYRSAKVFYKGWTIKQAKFCSMGNGFTFPLETLIFWALTGAVCGFNRNTVRSYGDDIICPTARAKEVITLLEICGFTINQDKSFIDGPFRESCGADYLRGINIRPVYVKTLITCRDLFRLHNELQEYFPEVATWIESLIPEDIRIYGPKGFGDGHLHGNDWGVAYRRKDGWAGWLFDSYTTKTKLERRLLPGDRILPTYSIYMAEPEENCIPDALMSDVTYFSRAPNRAPRLRCVNRDYATQGLDVVGRTKKRPNGTRTLCTLPSVDGKDVWYQRISIYTLTR
jgi:hypothetical protein